MYCMNLEKKQVFCVILSAHFLGCYESTKDEKQEELLCTLSTLQATIDVMKSPLFSSLVEIKQDYNQVYSLSSMSVS